MDFEPLMQRVARDGPQLAHWVVRVPDLAAALLPLNRAGLHPGDPVALSRCHPAGAAAMAHHPAARRRSPPGRLPAHTHPMGQQPPQQPAARVWRDPRCIDHWTSASAGAGRRTGSVEGTRPGEPRTRTHAAGPPEHPGWPGHPDRARAGRPSLNPPQPLSHRKSHHHARHTHHR
jgi:hypothetical protein